MVNEFKKEFLGLPKNFVVLTILPKEIYDDVNIEMLRFLIHDLGYHGAYVTVNKPYQSLKNLMEKQKISHERLFFVDCVTESKENVDNCIFLHSIESLTKVGMCLDPIYKNKDFSFLIFDSLDGLSMYHDSNIIIRFARNLIERTREHNMSGVMIGLNEETDKKVIDELSMVCDRVIDLT